MRIENSFIPVRGVDERTEWNFWRAGATCWDEFDASLAGVKAGGRIETFIADAAVHPDDGNSRFSDDCSPMDERWRLYESFRDEMCFFGIETTGLSSECDSVTIISFYRDGGTTTLISGEDLTADALREQPVSAKLIAAFNDVCPDVPFFEISFDTSVDVSHADPMYPCRTPSLTGGLGGIERDVGIDCDRPDISGCGAVRLWREYERGDQSAFDTLVSCNREGAVNPKRLIETVTGRLRDRAYEGLDADLA